MSIIRERQQYKKKPKRIQKGLEKEIQSDNNLPHRSMRTPKGPQKDPQRKCDQTTVVRGKGNLTTEGRLAIRLAGADQAFFMKDARFAAEFLCFSRASLEKAGLEKAGLGGSAGYCWYSCCGCGSGRCGSNAAKASIF